MNKLKALGVLMVALFALSGVASASAAEFTPKSQKRPSSANRKVRAPSTP
jgi:hypothetical protein